MPHFIISFLFKAFKQEQDGFITDKVTDKDLTEKLSDYLYAINKDEIQFSRESKYTGFIVFLELEFKEPGYFTSNWIANFLSWP
jgi:hypothetical protein